MMKYKSYPEYKDSGIEWIGEIPRDWVVKRLKYVCSLRNEKSDDPEKDYIALEHIESRTGKVIKKEDDEIIPEGDSVLFFKNNVLFGKLRPYLAKVIIATFDGKCSPELLVIESSISINNKFLFYSVLSEWFIDVVNSSTYGAKMPRASWGFIGNMMIPLPPLDQQTAIASFLDRETNRISSIIDAKTKLIEKLKEKRTAVISNTVTKGLDPDVKLKPSGIELIWEIPEGWEVKKLKYVCSINDDTLNEATFPDFTMKYVEIGSVTFEDGIKEYQEIIFENSPSRARRKVKRGDVIVSTVRTYLKAVAKITDDKEVIVSTGFAVIRPRKVIADYLSYFVKTPFFVETVSSNSVGVSYPAINASEMMNIGITLPPLSQQTAIADYLDAETSKIDSIIAKTQASIDKLNEYKTAIISAAVTGKIDVRGEVNG